MLEALHSDAAQAAAEYERLRRRAVQFFRFHGVADPEELADESLNRLARKISQGEQISKLPQYLAGIARMVLLEERHRLRRELQLVQQAAYLATADPPSDEMLSALESCLSELPPARVQFLQRYYGSDSRKRIDERQKMADEMGISVNSLRNRALRLRDKLEACVRQRREQNDKT